MTLQGIWQKTYSMAEPVSSSPKGGKRYKTLSWYAQCKYQYWTHPFSFTDSWWVNSQGEKCNPIFKIRFKSRPYKLDPESRYITAFQTEDRIKDTHREKAP